MRIIYLIGFYMFLTTVGLSQAPSIPTLDSNNRLIFSSKEHLKNFIHHYQLDYSDDTIHPILDSLEQNGFSSLLNIEERYLKYQQGNLQIPNDDIEDDMFVGDTQFATLLNEDYEIIVNGNLYKLEPDGMVYTATANETSLGSYLANRPETVQGTETYVDDIMVYDVGDGVYHFPFDYQNTANETITYPPTKNSIPTSFFNPYGLNSCEFDDDGFFEGILPGSSEKCIDKFASDKRIVTKFSNQNYFIYSSVYAKVKSQKKGFLGLWSRDNYCEFLELGLSNVLIKFPITYPTPPIYTLNYIIKNNNTGQFLDSQGNSQNFPYEPEDFFNDWPFCEPCVDFQIFFFAPDNDDLNGLVEDGVAALLQALGETFEDFFQNGDNEVGLAIQTEGGVYFSSFGERKRQYGVSRIQKTWDQNFIIGYNSNNDFPHPVIGTKTYDILALDIYGVGKYQGNYHGMRITTEGEVQSAPLTSDIDNDGVRNDMDICAYQAGEDNYEGCPYSVRNTYDAFPFVRNSIPSEANDYTFGSCYDLELKSADVPVLNSTFIPDVNKNILFQASESIIIKGEAGVTLKTVNSSEYIQLKIAPNSCNITGPILTSIPSPNSGYSENIQNDKSSDLDESILFQIFPNPTNGQITLQSQEAMSEWTITNQFGSLRVSGTIHNNDDKNRAEVDISHFPTGVYFVRVFFENGEIETKTLIRE